MKKINWLLGCMLLLASTAKISAHCQMPCGIYNDAMVFDQIDQYAKTMYKCISVMNNSKFSTTKERNEFIRWVLEKDTASDDVASMITKYFLQQKIKAGEPDTTKRLVAAHRLLADLVLIKQNADVKFVEDFIDEWEAFKLLFHREGYECDVEKLRLKREAAKRAAANTDDDHDHDHDHDHPHTDGQSPANQPLSKGVPHTH